MIEATKGPVLPRQTLREWVLQQRRSARSAEAVDRFSEVLKALDALTQNKPVRSVTVESPLPPPPGATPELPPTIVGGFRGDRAELETVASAEDAAGETMDQVRPRKARKSWTRRNVLKPNVTRKASRIVQRSAKEERNQRNQRNAAKAGPMTPAERRKAVEQATWSGLEARVKGPGRKGGRPQQGPAPMTPAERMKAYRERKRAGAKGGKGRRGGKKT